VAVAAAGEAKRIVERTRRLPGRRLELELPRSGWHLAV